MPNAATGDSVSGRSTSRAASPCTKNSIPADIGATVCDSVTVDATLDSWVRTRWTVSRSPAPACTETTGPSAGTSTDSACGPMSQSAPCRWRQGEAANGVPASADSHEPAPPASCVRAAWVSQGRRLEPEGEEHDRRDAGLAHGGHHAVGCGDVQGDRLLQQQVLAGRGGTLGQRRLHVRRQRDRDGVDLGQQLVDVPEPGDVELGAHGLGLREVPAPDPDQLGGGVRAQGRRVDLRRPVAGAQDAEAHRQTAPNWRSPASPSPGTMYAFSLRPSSTLAGKTRNGSPPFSPPPMPFRAAGGPRTGVEGAPRAGSRAPQCPHQPPG